MGKSLIRDCLAQGCQWTGILKAQERRAQSCLTILCYHRILPKAEKQAYFSPDLVVTPEAFAAHCRVLTKHYRVLPLKQALEAQRHGEGDSPLVALTFDDGYVDNAIHAAPILESFGLRATFFVVAGLVGKSTPPWYDALARCVQELIARGEGTAADGAPCPPTVGLEPDAMVQAAKGLPPDQRAALLEGLQSRLGRQATFQPQDLVMGNDRLRQLAARGHEIGSHSLSHEILPLLDEATLRQEIRESKRLLERAIDQEVFSFCYPNGDFDRQTLDQVRLAAYDQAVSTVEGANPCASDPFTLRRRFVHEDRLNDRHGRPSSTLFRTMTSGLRDRLQGRRPANRGNA